MRRREVIASLVPLVGQAILPAAGETRRPRLAMLLVAASETWPLRQPRFDPVPSVLKADEYQSSACLNTSTADVRVLIIPETLRVRV